MRRSPPQVLYLQAGEIVAELTEWSFGYGSWRVSSLRARLGIAIWTKALAQTLNFAAAVNAYALTDRATWANFKNRQNLEILTEGDPALLNFYGSILVKPARWPDVKYAYAETWHHWLTSRAGLDAITSYRIDGEEVFFPPRARL